MKGVMRMYCPKCKRVWRVNTNKKKCSTCGADMTPMPKKKNVQEQVETSKCDTCGYRWMNGTKSFTACQYILIEKKRRLCKGGDDCTAYRYSRKPFFGGI